MLQVRWLIVHVLPILGFLSALFLLGHLLREQRPPSSTIAWLLAILLIPYIGVPLYIILGGRKMRRMTGKKATLDTRSPHTFDPEYHRYSNFFRLVKSAFPLRRGNQLTVLPTGEEAFRQLMQVIEEAQESLYIATFILGHDDTGRSILEALTAKAGNGLEVCLLLDALGSMNISGHLLSNFVAAGGRYAFFMPMLHLPFRGRANLRNHRKIVIIDRKIAIVGGMNLAQEYMGSTTRAGRWHDLSAIVTGPVVADLYAVFYSDWKFTAKKELVHPPETTMMPTQDGSVALQLVPSGPDVDDDAMYDTIIIALFAAQQRIWIVTPYFIPDEVLLKALCIAAKRRVDVRIVVPQVSNHRLADLVRRSYLRQLQEAGAHICQFTPGMVHGKVILIDDSLGIIGSMNMDMRSFFLNYEIALFIDSEGVVSELERWIRDLMAQCTIGEHRVSGMVEFFEGIGRLFAPLL
jgi:cardiolipin synthase